MTLSGTISDNVSVAQVEVFNRRYARLAAQQRSTDIQHLVAERPWRRGPTTTSASTATDEAGNTTYGNHDAGLPGRYHAAVDHLRHRAVHRHRRPGRRHHQQRQRDVVRHDLGQCDRCRRSRCSTAVRAWVLPRQQRPHWSLSPDAWAGNLQQPERDRDRRSRQHRLGHHDAELPGRCHGADDHLRYRVVRRYRAMRPASPTTAWSRLSGTTSDNVTVSQVQVFEGSQSLGPPPSITPLTLDAEAPTSAQGIYNQLSATATDEAGNTATAPLAKRADRYVGADGHFRDRVGYA